MGGLIGWRGVLCASASTLIIGLGASPALAQTETAAGASATQLEEVVVTARKREENLQSVPVAITAATGAQLQQQGIRQPTDLARIVPSLSVAAGQSSPTGAIFNLRGQVAADITLNLSQAVGLYEDNVAIPHPEGSNLSFYDLSRIEVLKGPQGTLYGRNTTGGAVNLITRDADYSGVHGNVYLEAGNHGDRKYSGAVNVPLVDDVLSARLAYQHWDRDGFGRSRVTGQRFGGVHDDDTLRLSLRFNPMSSLSVRFKSEYDQTHISDLMQTLAAYVPTGSAVIEGILEAGGPAALTSPTVRSNVLGVFDQALGSNDYFTNSQNETVFNRVKVWHDVLDVNWDVTDSVRLRSVTGYHKFDDRRDFDLDGLPYQITEPGAGTDALIPVGGKMLRPLPPEGISHVWSQEFNLSGKFAERLDWLLGAYYSTEEGEGGHVTIALPLVQAFLTRLPNGALKNVDANGNIYRPIGSTYATSVGQDSWALFTQNDIHLSDRVYLTLGARYTEEKLHQAVNFYQYESVNANVANDAGPFNCSIANTGSTQILVGLADPAACLVEKSAKFSGTSYLASFNFQITPDVLFYAKTARGFRGGALQLRSPAAAPAAPEFATDYELGIKSDLFDKRLRTNLAVYQTNYSNKQETIIESDGVNPTPVTVVRNAADARIQGAEGETRFQPLDGLSVYGTVTFLQGTYLNYPTAVTPIGVIDASGQPFALPKWAYSLGTRYDFDAGPGRLGLQADWAWRGRVPLTPLAFNPAFSRAVQERLRAPVGLLNLRVDYSLPEHGVTLSAFATNALDKKYQTIGLDLASAGGILTATTMEPRMWGVSVRKTFGAE